MNKHQFKAEMSEDYGLDYNQIEETIALNLKCKRSDIVRNKYIQPDKTTIFSIAGNKFRLGIQNVETIKDTYKYYYWVDKIG